MTFDEMRKANEAAARLLGYRVSNYSSNLRTRYIYVDRPVKNDQWVTEEKFSIFLFANDLLDTINALGTQYNLEITTYDGYYDIRLKSVDKDVLVKSGKWRDTLEEVVADAVLCIAKGKLYVE